MIISKALTDWYSENKRSLPWRDTRDPYFIWLSEIILQQTKVNQGLPYYNTFIEKYPTVFDLAQADENDVLKLWQGLGYYSRARNLHFTARLIVDQFDGVFPNTYKELIQLKGVGDYTASAIASISFNEVTAVVDGNVYRVLARYYGIHTAINSTSGIAEFKKLAQRIIDRKNPAEFNQAIMEFGAVQCKPKNPECEICPLGNSCVAKQNNEITLLPVKLKKLKIKHRYFNFLVLISKDDRTIMEQRTGKGIWQNLFQFPLIESASEMTHKTFESLLVDHNLLRKKDFSVSLYNKDPIIHKLSHQHLHTNFWIIKLDYLNRDAISLNSIHEYPTPVLISNFINEFNF
jgi:A/G-specific adenine glycosylase